MLGVIGEVQGGAHGTSLTRADPSAAAYAAVVDVSLNLSVSRSCPMLATMHCSHSHISVLPLIWPYGIPPPHPTPPTQEERDSFGTRLLGPSASGGAGLVDVLRAQHPDVVAYTYYSYRFNCRAKGIGWRLDYCLTSPELAGDVHDAFILPDVMGSDHVPLGVTLKV